MEIRRWRGGGRGVLSNVMGKWSVGCHYARGLSQPHKELSLCLLFFVRQNVVDCCLSGHPGANGHSILSFKG